MPSITNKPTLFYLYALILDHNRLATILPLTNSLKSLSANSPSQRLPATKSTPSPLSTTNAQTIGRNNNHNNNGIDVDSAKIRQTSTKTTPSKCDSPRTITNGKTPNGVGMSVVRDKEAAVISIGTSVQASASVVSKAIGVNLGCGGDGSACNGKSTEALGVLLQYLVFHVSVFMLFRIYKWRVKIVFYGDLLALSSTVYLLLTSIITVLFDYYLGIIYPEGDDGFRLLSC